MALKRERRLAGFLVAAWVSCSTSAMLGQSVPAIPSPSPAAPAVAPPPAQSTAPGKVAKPGSTTQTTVESKSDAVVHSTTSQMGESSSLPEGPGVLVDQVVAVVNGDLVLESDVDEDRRFQTFLPFTNPSRTFNRMQAIERLIDRTLILQQAKLQPDSAVTDAEAQEQLHLLRKEIPACAEYHCETEQGWEKFVNHEGFTVAELNQRWKERMQVLKFIEIRFRSGIDISQAQIKAYYDEKLLPEYAKRNATAPKLDVLNDRIHEILLQQQVSALLLDWLKSLKAQGTIRVMTPAEGV